MRASRLRVTCHPRVPDARLWDSVIDAAGAPVFYRASIVTAYNSQPLQPTCDSRCFVAWRDGVPMAVLPLYLVPARDPFGERAQAPRLWAISHFWHCYDTRVPTLGHGNGLVAALWDAAARQADDWGAAEFGVMNTAERGAESAELARLASRSIRRGPRYRITLTEIHSFSDHLGRLRRSVAQDARRQLRRAEQAGVVSRIYRPPLPPEVISRVCELLEFTAARYNPGYYDSRPVAHLLENAGPTLRVPALQIATDLVAASVSFHDGRTLHNWAIGVEPTIREWFSPYVVLLKVSMDYAIDNGCRVIELGRTNPDWKQRVGARAVDLVTWMSDVRSEAPSSGRSPQEDLTLRELNFERVANYRIASHGGMYQ